MKKLRLIIIIALCLTNLVSIYAQSSTLDLFKQWMIRELNSGNYSKALSYFNQFNFVYQADEYDAIVDLIALESFCAHAFSQGITDEQKISLYKYWGDLCYTQGDYSYDQKQYFDAQQWLISAVHYYGSIQEFYPFEFALTNNMLGNAYTSEYKYTEADSAYLTALYIVEEMMVDTIGFRPIIIDNLTLNYLNLGDTIKAEKYFLKNNSIELPIDTSNALSAYWSTFAYYHYFKSEYKQAQPFFEKNLELHLLKHNTEEYIRALQEKHANCLMLKDSLTALDALMNAYDYSLEKKVLGKTFQSLLTSITSLLYSYKNYKESYRFCQELYIASTRNPIPNDNYKETALLGMLLNAIKLGDYAAAQHALASGANPNLILWNEHPLYQAISHDHIKFACDSLDVTKNPFTDLLLNAGAKVDVAGSDLEHAIMHEDYRLCYLLLKYGANPKLMTYDKSKTIIEYAEDKGLKRFVKLLKNIKTYSKQPSIQELDMLYKNAENKKDYELAQKYAEQALNQFYDEIDETKYTGFRTREQILCYLVTALVNRALISWLDEDIAIAEAYMRRAIQFEAERDRYPNKLDLGFGDLDRTLLYIISGRDNINDNILAINEFEYRKSLGIKDKYYWQSVADLADYYKSKSVNMLSLEAYRALLKYCSSIDNPLDSIGRAKYIRMFQSMSFLQNTAEDSLMLQAEFKHAQELFKTFCDSDSLCYYENMYFLGRQLMGVEAFGKVMENYLVYIMDSQDTTYKELVKNLLQVDALFNKFPNVISCNDSLQNKQFVSEAQPLVDKLEQFLPAIQSVLIQQWIFSNFDLQRWDKILAVAPQYVKNIQTILQEEISTMSAEMASDWLHNTNPFAMEHYINVAASNNEVNDEVAGALYNHQLFRKGLLLRNIDHLKHYLSESSDSSAIYLYEQIQSLRIQREKLREVSQYDSMVLELSREIDNKERILYNISHLYREQVKYDNIDWRDIKAKLKQNEVVIEFVNFGYIDQYYALVLRQNYDAPKLVYLPDFKRYPKEEKEFLHQWYLQDLTFCQENHFPDSLMPKEPHFLEFSGSASVVYEYGANGTELYHALWEPLDEYITKGETIYFAPSGLLHQLAIEHLPYDETRTMADVFNMVRLSSTREIVMNKPQSQYTSATVYGGIVYDADTVSMIVESREYPELRHRSIENDTLNRGSVKYLPGTKIEAEHINSLLQENNITAKLYTATKANEESFKSRSGKHDNILHIGTHGFTWTDSVAKKQDYFTQRLRLMGQEQHYDASIDPLNRCGLLFAGANIALQGNSKNLPEGVQDGILTAKEISLMDLRDADLVVLSACETAKGDITSEGVFGLQRAFKMAGVQTIIMSLWKVNDQATQLLMTEFYNNWIGKHQSKREAFRNAQNTVRTQYEEPEYWAGFIMLD